MILKVNFKGRVRLLYPCFLYMLRQSFSRISVNRRKPCSGVCSLLIRSKNISHRIAKVDLFFLNIYCSCSEHIHVFCLYCSESRFQIFLWWISSFLRNYCYLTSSQQTNGGIPCSIFFAHYIMDGTVFCDFLSTAEWGKALPLLLRNFGSLLIRRI